MAKRLRQVNSTTRVDLILSSERGSLSSFLTSWHTRWCPPDLDPLLQWWYTYNRVDSHMVGLLRIAKIEAARGGWSSATRQDVLSVATTVLVEALKEPMSMHMLRRTSLLVISSAIVLQMTPPGTPIRDIVLRMALRMAGNPRQDTLMTYTRHNGFQLMNMIW